MSVTFRIESIATGAFVAECYNDGDPIVLGPVDGYAAILPVMAAHKAECDECQHYGLHSSPVCDIDGALDVDVSSVNGRTLLVALGLDNSEDLCGALDGEAFLGRVLLAMATDRDDTGVRSAVLSGAEVGTRGATWIDCGLRPGYFADRFGALHALALEAARLGREIHWS
jgi:hypothetical protein